MRERESDFFFRGKRDRSRHVSGRSPAELSDGRRIPLKWMETKGLSRWGRSPADSVGESERACFGMGFIGEERQGESGRLGERKKGVVRAGSAEPVLFFLGLSENKGSQMKKVLPFLYVKKQHFKVYSFHATF